MKSLTRKIAMLFAAVVGICLAGYFATADQAPVANTSPQPAPNTCPDNACPNCCPNGCCPNGCCPNGYCPNGYCREIRVEVCKQTPRRTIQVDKRVIVHDGRYCYCPPHRETIERHEAIEHHENREHCDRRCDRYVDVHYRR